MGGQRVFAPLLLVLIGLLAITPVSGQTFKQQRSHAEELVKQVVGNGQKDQRDSVLADVGAATTSFELAAALRPLVLADVSLNPESRVKIATRRSRIAIAPGKPQRFLLRIENLAGSTAPLVVHSIDLATAPPEKTAWLEVKVLENEWTSRELNGLEHEYKVIELIMHEAGLHEVRLVAEAGQGTQDLGFRATTDLLIDGSDSNVVRQQ